MNRKQLRSATATVTALSALLAGCGGSGSKTAPKAAGPVTIVMWGWTEERLIQPVVDKCNATHAEIKVKYVMLVLMISLQRFWRAGITLGSLR